jgi:hypothetical protein
MSVAQAGGGEVIAEHEARPGRLSMFSAIAAAWVLSQGIDLFLHAGLLARLYVRPSTFLLPAEDAFRRLPLGYLTFLILSAGLYWLFHRMHVRGSSNGFRIGAVMGGVSWGALALGLYSISTATVTLLAAWWIGQTVELAFAGAVLGAAGNRVPLKRIWLIVIVAVVVLGASTVALQSLGLAPAIKLAPDTSSLRLDAISVVRVFVSDSGYTVAAANYSPADVQQSVTRG